jgi:deoxyribodipyrimidine photo-lyase
MGRSSVRTHYETSLWWIRRDLRIEDNQALASAIQSTERVIPTFVLDPTLMRDPSRSEKREAFLLAGLRQLDQDLRARGSRLILRQGPPEEAIAAVAADTGANIVFAERDFSPYAKRRDQAVARLLPLELVTGETIHPPEALLTPKGSPRRVFTPFRRAWQALPLPSPRSLPTAPSRLPSVAGVASISLPDRKPPESFPPGEAEARCRLAAFTSGDQPAIHAYAETRNRVDLDGTSSLSPYFRFGMLSPLRALATARQVLEGTPDAQARRGVEEWISQLIWRDFYLHTLDAFPGMLLHPLRPAFAHLHWEADPEGLKAWQAGLTGYPIVDAGMRQLREIGWMPNRARMIVGSFLTKDLLVDWRLGQEWFMHHLVDADPAANAGGWQWVSGAGTDAAPFFRVFNPALQGKKFDPRGDYIMRWIPQLSRVPQAYIHEPWRMPIDVQRASGCLIGHDYPAPIVEHAQARARALAAYRAAVASGRTVHAA